MKIKLIDITIKLGRQCIIFIEKNYDDVWLKWV